MSACHWSKEHTYCDTHGCGFGEPCVRPGCPHCGSTPESRRYGRLVGDLGKAEAALVRDEARLARLSARVVREYRQVKALRARLARMEGES